MSTWDDKPNDYEHALAQIAEHKRSIEIYLDEIRRLRAELTLYGEELKRQRREIERLRAEIELVSK